MCQEYKDNTCGYGAPYVISSPGGRVDADWIVKKVPLDMSERIFETDVIVLSGQWIYDI
jgi:hypothetical protein